jgi:hypothetical protein
MKTGAEQRQAQGNPQSKHQSGVNPAKSDQIRVKKLINFSLCLRFLGFLLSKPLFRVSGFALNKNYQTNPFHPPHFYLRINGLCDFALCPSEKTNPFFAAKNGFPPPIAANWLPAR